MVAVAVCGPGSMVPPTALTVIVSTWFVPTGLFAVAGAIWMLAPARVPIVNASNVRVRCQLVPSARFSFQRPV